MDPCVGDYGKHELCCLLSRRVESSAVGALFLVGQIGLRTDNGHSVVIDIRIIGPDSCGLGERLAVAGNVSGLRPNKADEVVDCSRFVIQDLQ